MESENKLIFLKEYQWQYKVDFEQFEKYMESPSDEY